MGSASAAVPATPAASDDSPTDALSAFLAAARKPEAGPAPDARVSVAFALGWQMAELYRPDRRRRRVPARSDDLPGLGSLNEAQAMELGLHQVDAALAKLSGTIEGSGQGLSPIQSAAEAVRAAPDDAARRELVLALHIELLSTLTAADFRLGKAYGLGRALADTCRNPETVDDLQREFRSGRIATLGAWVGDLSSALPPHAGHAVRDSLDRWCKRITTDSAPGEWQLKDVLSRLRRQGELWRALLSGEKFGKDMLELSNYARAAESLVVRMRDLALQFISRFRLMVGLIVLLFAGGVLLILALRDSASTAAGLGGIIASVGLTWKGVGGSLGRAVARVEKPAWDAQLDIAIADAITLIPKELLAAPATPTKRARVKRLLSGGAPADVPSSRP